MPYRSTMLVIALLFAIVAAVAPLRPRGRASAQAAGTLAPVTVTTVPTVTSTVATISPPTVTITPMATAVPTATPFPPSPTPTPPPTPSPTPQNPLRHRYVVLIPGLCATVPALGLQCYPHPNELIDANWRAWSTFRALGSALQPWMDANGVRFAYYSYRVRPGTTHPTWYYAADTKQPIPASARALDRQLRAIVAADPRATFDLVAHSLGGVIAAYWVAHVARPDSLTHVHTLITLDSPLQGNWAGHLAVLAFGLRVSLIEQSLTGAAGAGLEPNSTVIRSVRSRTAQRLPGRVYTIGNWRDIIVNALESWLGHARQNRDIIACQAHDAGCHGTVLDNRDAIKLEVHWIEQ